jgi:hypothetical protein
MKEDKIGKQNVSKANQEKNHSIRPISYSLFCFFPPYASSPFCVWNYVDITGRI